MDIDRVRYFHVFAETGSLVAASDVLHISQPALSKALKLLEQEIGIKLVKSHGRGLKLTADGTEFISRTAPLLTAWMEIPKLIQTGAALRSIKIGSFEVFTTYFLESLCEHVDLRGIELHDLVPGKLEKAITEGLIDIGITYLPIPDPGVEFIEVTKIQMGVFGQSKFSDRPFETLPFVVPLSPVSGSPSKVVGLDGWPDHKFKRTIEFNVSMMESAMQLCRQGLAVAYLPKFVVRLHNQNVIARCKLHELVAPQLVKDRLQSVYLIVRKGESEVKLHRQIAKSLRALS
ncbi:MAG TPA: LysR family transcriptional regulator [Bacteriovoracaceae bacterium]|nr:LysR family transcriptional regulator [Bacteriovoracaceae bacterium]